jgi:regulator of protease activity HflC (stomatin/prohibitin superfamily)
MTAIGEHNDIRDKLMLPYIRSLCRIEGSKLHARDFIAGDTRIAFQQRVFEGLREQTYAQGIEARAALIRRIVPPAEIANPISDRQVAGQQIKQYENEIKLAQSEATLVEQQEMQKQNLAVGQASREVVSIVKEAEQGKEVALIQARQRLEVARLQLEAASQTAQAILWRGQAEAEVKRLEYEAQAKPLGQAVTAFGDGERYAQYFFYQKLGPALKSVLASTDGPFAEIFRSLSEAPFSRDPKGSAVQDSERGASAADGAARRGGRP